MAEYRTCPVHRNPAQVAVVGAGAAGLYTALACSAPGCRGDTRLRHPARGRLELLGAGWARGRAGRRRHAGTTPARHGRGGPRRGARVRRAGARQGGARGCWRADRARRQLRRRRRRGAVARARGRPLSPADRPRRRRRDRPSDHRPAVVGRRPASGHRGDRGPQRGADPDRRRRPDRGIATQRRRGHRHRRRSSSRPVAPPRCGRAPPTRPAPIGGGLLLAHDAGRTTRRPRTDAVSSDRRRRPATAPTDSS